ncbi:MAG: endolytic transglycosylase MltG [Rhodospirillales bacterium]|nr:endolytic transglycosylase MltG [Rhodospirillales bacterium]
MLKRLVRILVILLLVIGLAGGAVLFWGWERFHAPGPLAESTHVLVKRGQGLIEIGRQLAQAGVIFDEYTFFLGARWGEPGRSLKAGEYAFPAHVPAAGVVAMMRRGETVIRKVTVAEGLTVAQVMALLRSAEGLEGALEETPLEGSLLPETYHFSWGDSRETMLQRMRGAMRQTLDGLWSGRRADLPLKSKEDALILASVVERETGLPEERPHVAAVFLNRLRQGMKLQSDPTVIYGLSNGAGVLDHALTRDDLAKPHPYNTYVIEGLPPGPIANPGKASLAAVLNPADSEDLYFVADGSGGHVFARSLSEHNRNVARWRQIEKQRKQGE